MDSISSDYSRCDLFVVFGTDSYGEKTTSKMGTHYEFDEAYQSDVKKTIAHINMTDAARKGLNGIKATFTHENLKRLHQVYYYGYADAVRINGLAAVRPCGTEW